jgi:hypothetical protein
MINLRRICHNKLLRSKIIKVSEASENAFVSCENGTGSG